METQAQTTSHNAAARALEQRQAHRPEATTAAKTCMVDPYRTANGRTRDLTMFNLESTASCGVAMSSHFGSRTSHQAGMRSIAPQCGRGRPAGPSGLN